MSRRFPLFLLVAVLLASAVAVLTPRAAADGEPAPTSSPRASAERRAVTFDGTYREAVRSLPVEREVRRGYDPDAFPHWTGQGDGCDTRDRVLIAEATRGPRVDGDCDLTRGRWVSAYDGERFTDPSGMDIDHAVALAEAWDSGARRWTLGTRTRYANDLGDPRSLIAVSASSNRSKSDRDPTEWLPDRLVCAYLAHWVATKVRWHLSVDPAEHRLLASRTRSCGNPDVRVVRARVR